MQVSRFAKPWLPTDPEAQAWLSTSIKFDAGSEAVADLFDRRLEKIRPQQQMSLPSTRTHALQLYRKIIRYLGLFDWKDELGLVWRDKLIASARSEIYAARSEQDPEVIARLIFTSREAVDQVIAKLLEKRETLQTQGPLPTTGAVR